ncbi:MAG: riboflavin synthase [Chloroflexota bacterium]
MFTGIVEEVGRVSRIQPAKLTVSAGHVLQGVSLGDSVAVNGVCLTITDVTSDTFSIDLMPETLRRTNLGALKAGDVVNLERPLTLSGRLGGHLVQGHVDGMAKLSGISREGEARLITLEASPDLMRYIVEKGFVAVDGISLTVAARDEHSFEVSIVDYTRQHTNIGGREVGDTVNIEVDIIGKYVEQFMVPKESSGVTLEFLREHGFLGARG